MGVIRKTLGYALIWIMIIASLFSGCSFQRQNNKRSDTDSSDLQVSVLTEEQCNEISEKISTLISKYSTSQTENIIESFEEEFEKLPPQDKVDFALSCADDMTLACMYGLEDNDLLAIAGEIVKEYPHPLLLNNYGAMIAEKSPDDAVFLIMQAIGQEPNNPVYLTNLANVYIIKGEFSEAQNFAGMALEASPGYCPAYQVLATIHLKNGDDILAAETMVKSAVGCFNSISIHQFEKRNADWKTTHFRTGRHI